MINFSRVQRVEKNFFFGYFYLPTFSEYKSLNITMSHQLVPVNQDDQKELKSILMKDGIRISQAEAEYQAYMEQLYSTLNPENSPISHVSTERTLMIHHPWHNVGIGDNFPDVVNVCIEIPAYSRVKTELDNETGLLKVDHILSSSVIYPANYGFVPETLADDDNPVDILVLCQLSVPPLSLMRARPIGIMPMIKNGESRDKIISVAISDPEYNTYEDIDQLPPFKLLMINQFFNDYRTLEKMEVKTFKPLGKDEAKKFIKKGFERYHQVYDEE